MSDRPLMLVTGSSGLIGTLVARTFAPDFTVVGLDRKPPKDGAGAGFILCDLTRDDDTARALAELRRRHGDRIASVIHLAAYYDFSGEPSPLYRNLTVEGTRRLLRGLKAFGHVEQFVFSGTLLVMKPAVKGELITESSPLEDAPWAYPRSKIEAEEAIRAERGGIPAVALRMAGVYSEEGNSIPIGQHIARIHGKRLESRFFPGDPDHGVPYVHLDDLADCFRRVVDRRGELGGFEVFLVAEPEVMSHRALQDAIGRLVHGRPWPAIRIPKAAAKAGARARAAIGGGEEAFIKPWMIDLADAHYPVSIRRAEERLGWAPRRRLRDTLPAMIRRLKEDPRRFYEANGIPLPAGMTPLDAHPPGLDYNPSSWRQRIPICLLAGAAFLMATAMALYQWRLVGDVWDPVFGGQSRRVLDSEASEVMRRWMRMPDAALGAIGYLSEVLFGLAGSTRRWQDRPWMVVLFGIDVIPLGIVSAVLVGVQGAVIGAWCFLCLATAAVSLALVPLAFDEVWATLKFLWRVWKRTGDWKVMWKTFWGQAVPEAAAAALEEGAGDVGKNG